MPRRAGGGGGGGGRGGGGACVGGGTEGGGEALCVVNEAGFASFLKNDEAGGASAGTGLGIRDGSKETLELGEMATEGELEERRDEEEEEEEEKKRRLGEAPDQR